MQTQPLELSPARERWRSATNAGFQIVPNVLFRAQQQLGLDATDVVILLNICMHWWSKDDLPYPRPSIIARRVGVGTRTVERRIARLEGQGLIERLAPEKSDDGPAKRRFDLSGLVASLEVLAQHNLQHRDAPPHGSSES